MKRQFSSRENLFGVKCQLCGRRVRERKNVENHHINGNIKDNRKDNLAWLCLKCHGFVSKSQRCGRPKKKVKKMSNPLLSVSGGHAYMREKNGVSSTELVKDLVDYEDGSPQMRSNVIFEVSWRNFCEAVCRRSGRIDRKMAIYGGAEEVGANPSTTWRYYMKWVSPRGRAVERREGGVKFAVLREESAASDEQPIKKKEVMVE